MGSSGFLPVWKTQRLSKMAVNEGVTIMSLAALPVSASDLETLQQGIQFFTNTTEATSEASAINTPGSGQSVFTYAASLLDSNVSLSQVAMAVGAIAESGTLAVGNAATPNTLTHFTMQFLPAQIAYATAHHFNQTVYAAEALGEALSGTTGFGNDWGGLSTSAFVTAVSTATGIHASEIAIWLTNWTSLLGNQALAYGATLGDAIGTALLNPTPANLETVFSTNTSNPTNTFSPNIVSGSVANALIGNADGQYVTGAALGALPAHTPLQGEFVSITGTIVTLTTGVDTVHLTHSNSTVNGTLGGAGAGSTLTTGDTITAAAGTTNETFNIDGIGSAAVINPTTVGPGNSVSGVETVNIVSNVNVFGLSDQAVQGNFTATGSEGDWVGLTTLNVTSGGNATGVDVLKVDATTAVDITDTLLTTTSSALTVTGGSVITITEDNLYNTNAGITVNGGTGTTTVSITQTEGAGATGLDGLVTITDVNGASTTAAGTITTVTLNGLSAHATDNTITDNALTSLTVWNSDTTGSPSNGPVNLDIVNNLTSPTNTTLSLTLNHNGVDAAGLGDSATSYLSINDTNNEITTIHLATGPENSFVVINDDGLVTLDTPTASTGALIGVSFTGVASTINDHVATAVNFDFSGLNAANDIYVDRGVTNNNDVYTLGNGPAHPGAGLGSLFNAAFPNTYGTGYQEFGIQYDNPTPSNAVTINFGSGAYFIYDNSAVEPGHNYVNTAPNGANLANLNSTAIWAALANTNTGDTLLFKGDSVQTIDNAGAVGSLAAGLNIALAQAAHTVTAFNFGAGTDTVFFDHVDNSTNITAKDAMVEVTGVAYNANTLTSVDHVVHFA